MPPIEPRRDGGGAFFALSGGYADSDVCPEAALVGAVLARAIADVQRKPTATKLPGRLSLVEQCEAIEFLMDRDQIEFWAGLLGLDGSWLQQQLLVASGLSEARPQQDERHAPAPRQKPPHTQKGQPHGSHAPSHSQRRTHQH